MKPLKEGETKSEEVAGLSGGAAELHVALVQKHSRPFPDAIARAWCKGVIGERLKCG